VRGGGTARCGFCLRSGGGPQTTRSGTRPGDIGARCSSLERRAVTARRTRGLACGRGRGRRDARDRGRRRGTGL